MAVGAHRALGCRGVSRADFRYDDTAGEAGRLFLLEVNTQPGLTPTSLLPDRPRHVGIFPRICALDGGERDVRRDKPPQPRQRPAAAAGAPPLRRLKRPAAAAALVARQRAAFGATSCAGC